MKLRPRGRKRAIWADLTDRVRVITSRSPAGTTRYRIYLPDGFGGGWWWIQRKGWLRDGPKRKLGWYRTYRTMRAQLAKAITTRPGARQRAVCKSWRPVSAGYSSVASRKTTKRREWRVDLDAARARRRGSYKRKE